ncbi:MAG: hypothetical protein KatS3mg121_0891 [Gammaproteobacteria bacterium]|nr:MAG: hypothetical protein KatS3mg121_0891 [Gammaproteobacteria bacterium]
MSRLLMWCAVLGLLLSACGGGDPPAAGGRAATPVFVAELEVHNPSAFARPDEPLVLDFDRLGLKRDSLTGRHLEARAAGGARPLQLIDDDGDGVKDSVLLLLDLAPGERQKVEIRLVEGAAPAVQARSQAVLSVKEGGRWVGRRYEGGDWVDVRHLRVPPEHKDHSEFIRFEGPGLETNRVAWRLYLDQRNGVDVFGKKTADLVLQDVGRDGFESYHHMADWGMDILKVGNSLGAGSFGFWNGERAERVEQVGGWEAWVEESGPLYSAVRIHYRDWQVAGRKVNLTARLSTVAGSRLLRVRLELDGELPNLAAGLVKHPDTRRFEKALGVTRGAYAYLGTWGRQSLAGDELGLALLWLDRFGRARAQPQTERNHLVVFEPTAGRVEYSVLAAWAGEPGGVRDAQGFVQMLDQTLERLAIPPRVLLRTAHAQAQKPDTVDAATALAWAQRMADSDLPRKVPHYAWGGLDPMRYAPSRWSYTTTLLMQSFEALAGRVDDPRYRDAVETVIGSFITEDGGIHTYDMDDYNIDDVQGGRILLRLYDRTGEVRYRKAADLLRTQLRHHPRTEQGAFWHKARYPQQVWLDGVYMAMPFLVEYLRRFEDGGDPVEVMHEFEVVETRLRDPGSGLYYHAWDASRRAEWADPQTGRSALFWGRGMGWLAMALVDTLEQLPEDGEAHAALRAQLQGLADALLAHRDRERGLWYQIVDAPQRTGNYLESSASAMYVYALAKGANRGWLAPAYGEAAVAAFASLLDTFVLVDADGEVHLSNICMVAGLGYGRDGSWGYYMREPVVDDDPKGVAPFVLAALEVARFLESGAPAQP